MKLLNVAFHRTRKLETQSLSALVLVRFYFITMALTTHCCHALLAALVLTIGEGGRLKMQVGEITLLPLLDYLPTIGLSYSLMDIIKMIYCSTEANMSDNYFVTQQ